MIWFFLATQIAFNLFLLRGLANNGVTVLLLSNVVPGVLSIPGVFLFFNYYKHSARKKFIVTYNSLKYFDEKTGLAVELRNEDIEHVYIVENVKGSKFPWASHQYFAFADKNGKTIIITCYLMDISEFWTDSLTRRVKADRIIHKEKLFPIIKMQMIFAKPVEIFN